MEEEETVVLAVSVTSDLASAAVSVVTFLILVVSFFVRIDSLLRDFAEEVLDAFADLSPFVFE